MKRRIAVIGGGISGLSAAWYLQKHEPFDVHLFEGSHRLGGVIATDHLEGRIIERGADNFATLIPDALNMTREMGFEDAMIHPNLENRLARVVHAGKIWPIPQGFSLMQPTRLDAIMASRILSWKGKLRVAAEYCIPARRDTTDESLKDFAVRRLGREAFERLVEPIVGGIFTAQAGQLSMQGAMPEFVDMERKHGGLLRAFLAKRRDQKQAKGGQAHEVKKASGARYDQFVAPKDGMQSWLDQIIQRLNGTSLEIGCAVEGIEPTSEGWWLHFHHRAKERFDGVVVALPAPAAASVLSMALPSVAVHLKAIPYASSAVVVMIVNRNEVDPQDLCFGIVVPQVERRDVLAISMTSEKYPEESLRKNFFCVSLSGVLSVQSSSRKRMTSLRKLLGTRRDRCFD